MEPLEVVRLLLIVLVGLTVTVVGGAWFLIRSSTIVDRWAERNGYRIVERDWPYLFRGPFTLRSSKYQLVCRVTVQDRMGTRKSGWVCFGSRFFGPLLSDKVDEVWDDSSTLSSESCWLFDYFVCSRPHIERWAEALASGDEHHRETLEAEMPRVVTFKNLGPDEVGILAQCATGGEAEAVDVVRSVNEQKILAFRQAVIDSIAAVQVDESLLQRWAKQASKFNGQSEAENRQVLLYGAARKLKDLCTLAVDEALGVFTCIYK